MSAQPSARDDSLRDALAADPLADLLGHPGIADLAFRSVSRADESSVVDRHLALLDSDSLELDLSDPAQRHFGNYELIELIGEGGMGVVYRARQHGLDRDVAVKLLAAGPWASRDFIERFQREAQNAARMQHPNIVPIYEVSSAEELHFFSMRLIRGGSLSALLTREGRLEARRAAQLLRTIAEAVDYAHRLGVLHLDLKPANVLLDDAGAPHVADFGLARRLEHGLTADNEEISGTPSYMAPEQAATGVQRITPATDIWGLGAIGYELVTGAPPFLGNSPQETLKLVVEGTLRSPRRYVPDVPRDLEAIIEKCMARDVAQRYASARELADDLGRFLAGYEVRARPLSALQRTSRWARREPKLALTALFAFAALMIGLLASTTQWRRAEAQKRVAQEQNQLALKNESTSNTRLWQSRRDAALRLQGDGKGFEALPALIANIEEQEKAGTSAAIERREVGMILHEGVTLIDRMIIADAVPYATALSPDGSLLAIGLNDVSVRWYDTATLTERGRIDLLDQPTSDSRPRAPRLLRFTDNDHLLVTLDWFDYLASPANVDTIQLDLKRGRVRAPPPAFSDLAYAVYSADGQHALLNNHAGKGQLWQVEPWLPLSAEFRTQEGTGAAMPWLLSRGAYAAMHIAGGIASPILVDMHDPQIRREVEALRHRPITAWQESRDGARIALGDEDGHVYLLEVKNAAVRELPVPAGSPVTWIAFSEDDAWIAAARHDGDVFAFDAASGNTLHSGSLQHDFEPHLVAISRRDNLLIVSGIGGVALWRMPEQGPRGGSSPAMRVTGPSHVAHSGLLWAGEAFQVGLMATADMDGEVRLWRLPVELAADMRSATRLSDRMRFDSARLVDVAYDRIRVTGLDGRKATDWIALPQPAAFAELVDDARTALAIAGHTLYAFDAATLQPRYAPLQLTDSPNYLAVNPAGTRAAMAFGHNGVAGFEMHLQLFDLLVGKPLPDATAIVRGQIRLFEFSPDGQRLLVVGQPGSATELFDGATLRRTAAYQPAADRPVIWASFTADSASLWLLETGIDQAETDSGRLVRWDVRTESVLERRDLTGSRPLGVRTVGERPLLATNDGIVLDPGGEHERAVPILQGGEMTTVFALSEDQRLIAHAYGRNVQLYDAATLDPVGSPLPLPWFGDNGVVRLAFDASGRQLLALLGQTRRVNAWNIGADTRRIEDLQRDAELLAPAPRTRRVLRLADAAEHAWLRSRDPGAVPTATARPAPPYNPNASVVRDPATNPLLLDLSRHYTTTPFSLRRLTGTVMSSLNLISGGIQRLDGVDYDVRGGVELRGMQAANVTRHDAMQRQASGISVPQVPIAAFHVLLYSPLPLPESSERTYASLRLHYRNGGEAVLPIRIQHEVPGMTGHDPPTPIGWVNEDLIAYGILPLRTFGNPRLPNPHPERIIVSLDLEAGLGWSEPVFLGVTAEPVEKIRTSQ